MKYHAFYIDNNVLIRMINKTTTSSKLVDGVSVLYNEDTIIGYNIFDLTLEGIDSGLIKLDENINSLINERLLEINHDALELDTNNYFVVGYTKSIEKHPNSDRLNVLMVDVKDEVLQIVCGASNVDANQLVVVAKVGAVLFDGTWIQAGELMKVTSNGMICSAKELNLEKTSKGILVLDDSYKVGDAF